MKICVPVAGSTGSRVASHFGRAPRLAIASTETGELEILESRNRRPGPEGDHHLTQLLEAGVEAVACQGMGRRAFRILEEAGIAVMIGPHDTVSEMLAAVRSGYLRPASEEDVCPGAGRGPGEERAHAEAALDRCSQVRLPR